MVRTGFFSGFNGMYWRTKTALEVGKFSLYVFVPLGASVFYANPTFMHDLIARLRMVTYPQAAPPPPVGEEIDKFRLSRMIEEERKRNGTLNTKK